MTSTSIRARVALLAWLACSVLACKDSGGPPLPGICGLEGTRVWCYEDWDCVQYNAKRCTSKGVCDYEEEMSCTNVLDLLWGSGMFLPFGGCLHSDQVCVQGYNRCFRYCRTHDDCGDGAECRCGGPLPNLGYCWSGRCKERDGVWRCPEGTEPTTGSLTCQVPNREGVCHFCGEGYIRVGEVGCEPLFDCGNGVLEAGEDCDGTDLGGATCFSVGLTFRKGDDRLRCRDDCGFDVYACGGHFPYGPGGLCEVAADISSEVFPHQLSGNFDFDGGGGDCALPAYNSVFYRYTPALSGTYSIDTVNMGNTTADTGITVYEGTGCASSGAPDGIEVACTLSAGSAGLALVNLQAGIDYLIQVSTSEFMAMIVDPEITVESVSPAPPAPAPAAPAMPRKGPGHK